MQVHPHDLPSLVPVVIEFIVIEVVALIILIAGATFGFPFLTVLGAFIVAMVPFFAVLVL